MAIAVSMLAGCKEPGTGDKDPESTEGPQINYDEIKTEYEERTDFSVSPTSNQLIYDGEWQDRWLSIPDSRIVINPSPDYGWDTSKPQSEFLNSTKIPLNVGHLNPYTTSMGTREIFFELLSIWDGKDDKIAEAKSYNTSWSPHALYFNAEYESGLKINGKDYFYNEKTVIREITYEGSSMPVICGSTDFTCTREGSSILIKDNNFVIAISFSQDFDLTFYDSVAIAERGLPGSDTQGRKEDTFWKVKFKEEPENKTIAVAVTVDTKDASNETVIKVSSDAANDKELDKRFKERIFAWNEYFKKVPIPGTYEFEMIEDKGATPAEVDRMYYTAWTLLAQCVLPKATETGFNYRQMSCGKPSMWAEGEPKAVFTAAWDSIYGIHMYAYIDPEVAWDCFEGFMTLVEHSDDPNRNGMISGESLPTNRSRTAWLIYQMNPDKEKLERVYEDLNVNLYWSMNHTYWIHKGNNPLDAKLRDSDFTASVLVDIPYMIKICNELGKADDAKLWQDRFNEFIEEFPSWHTKTVKRKGQTVLMAQGEPLWTSKSLYIPELSEEVDNAFFLLLDSRYNKKATFAGFTAVKLEEIMYCIYGLYDNADRGEDYIEIAKTLNECSIREVVRASAFGENYTSDPRNPRTTGVRPSLFGVVQLIDSIWIRNGYRYDSGEPELQNFFSEGSLKNIHFGDKEFSYTMKDGQATVTGSLVDGEKTVTVESNKSAQIR